VSKENNIFLTDMTDDGLSDDVVFVSAEPPPMYQLRILYTNEDRTLNLNFASSKTIIEIKNDIYAVLKVPVRHQVWVGWPQNSSNDTMLSDTGINAIHALQLTSSDMDSNNTNRDV
jgi:FAS-associated factor 1